MSWFDEVTLEAVRCSFEQHLPKAWVFFAFDEGMGAIRWKRELANGFVLELLVHPVYKSGSDFIFQSKLFLMKSFSSESGIGVDYSELLGGKFEERDKNFLLASIYLEGLHRVRRGGKISLVTWSKSLGLSDGALWSSYILHGMTSFNLNESSADSCVQALFSIDCFDGDGFPPSVALFGNIFILAALCAAVNGHYLAATEYLSRGKGMGWSQDEIKPSLERLADIECKSAFLERIVLIN